MSSSLVKSLQISFIIYFSFFPILILSSFFSLLLLLPCLLLPVLFLHYFLSKYLLPIIVIVVVEQILKFLNTCARPKMHVFPGIQLYRHFEVHFDFQ